MDATTMLVIEDVVNESFEGGIVIGMLENDGVGLAPFHDLDDMVSDDLKAELEIVRGQLVVGDLSALP
jgi:basic membrane protein A